MYSIYLNIYLSIVYIYIHAMESRTNQRTPRVVQACCREGRPKKSANLRQGWLTFDLGLGLKLRIGLTTIPKLGTLGTRSLKTAVSKPGVPVSLSKVRVKGMQIAGCSVCFAKGTHLDRMPLGKCCSKCLMQTVGRKPSRLRSQISS